MTPPPSVSIQYRGQAETSPVADPPGLHRRNYQACIPCRRRKVKCNLGNVDDPSDPPCMRCRRESKDCFFSATRRKRKHSDQYDVVELHTTGPHEARSAKKRANSETTRAAVVDQSRSSSFSANRDSSPAPLTPGGGVGQPHPLRRPNLRSSSPSARSEDSDDSNTNTMLQTREVLCGSDALHLLYEATGQKGDHDDRENVPAASIYGGNANGRTIQGTRGEVTRSLQNTTAPEGRAFSQRNGVHPSTSGNQLDNTKKKDLNEAYRVWSKLRFVRAGWFSAREGVAYIDYFYKYLCPLTPITVPDFQGLSTHRKLLTEEPMLVITMLTISSRYMLLQGTGGPIRGPAIHERLWKYLQGMIERMMYSQEQFNGGFGGATSNRVRCPTGYRALGTVESLLLLTEWHPRALHFPPADDNDELLVDADSLDSEYVPEGNDNFSDHVVGGMPTVNDATTRRIDSWLEPCWRSDRMSWTLLAMATSLAAELGVLDGVIPDKIRLGMDRTAQKLYLKRAHDLHRLCFVYATQISGRLSLPNVVSKEYFRTILDSDVGTPSSSTIESSSARSGDRTNVEPNNDCQEAVLNLWCGIAKMFFQGNDSLFKNREETQEIIRSGKYGPILDKLEIMHLAWKANLDSCEAVPTHMRHILNIEYEYMRVYGNCLALQAVFNRCANNSPRTHRGAIPPPTLVKWLEGDRKYIAGIISSSQNLLRTVTEGLLPDSYLKHAPVRTYFRIVSVSMILLKTFALGASQDDVSASLGLLDKAVDAMRHCLVDDVHAGARFADMLRILTGRVRSRIVRINKTGQYSTEAGNVASGDRHDSQPFRNPSTINEDRQPEFSGRTTELHGTKPPSTLANTTGQIQASDRTWPHGNSSFGPYHPQDIATSMHPPSSQYQAHLDPLHGIPHSSYDPLNPAFSIMPPPPYGFQDAVSSHGQSSNGTNGDLNTFSSGGTSDAIGLNVRDHPGRFADYNSGLDWLAMPLDPLLQDGPAEVTHGVYGPEIGGLDVLEPLLGNYTFGLNDGFIHGQ